MKRVLLPLTALAAFTVELLPGVTGVAFHEYFGIAAAVLLLVHAMASFRAGAGRFDKVLDFALLGALAVCMVSGILISGSLLPGFGVFIQADYFLLQPLHAIAAKLMLALLLVHAASHVAVLRGAFRR